MYTNIKVQYCNRENLSEKVKLKMKEFIYRELANKLSWLARHQTVVVWECNVACTSRFQPS